MRLAKALHRKNSAQIDRPALTVLRPIGFAERRL
jgi:hypothetical protein